MIERTLVLLLTLTAGAPALAQTRSYTVGLEAWAMARDGAAVAALEDLRAAVQAWEATSNARLRIGYAGGEDGEIRAAELRDWMIALGIPGRAIETVPGGVDPAVLEVGLLD
jgi:hypothetical protein